MSTAADARLAALRLRFVERCRGDLAVLRQATPPEILRPVLHRLAGAGGTFGYPEISRLAAAAEDDLLSGRPLRLEPLIAALKALAADPPG